MSENYWVCNQVIIRKDIEEHRTIITILTRPSMLELEVFILKFISVDGPSTRSIVAGEVTTLAHKVGDDSVED